MDTAGRHLLVEAWGCRPEILVDVEALDSMLRAAAERALCTPIDSISTCFDNGAVSVVLLVSESHLSIHTWPEAGYAAIDMYTCGGGVPENALDVVHRVLQPARFEAVLINRGGPEPPGVTLEHYGLWDKERPGNGA